MRYNFYALPASWGFLSRSSRQNDRALLACHACFSYFVDFFLLNSLLLGGDARVESDRRLAVVLDRDVQLPPEFAGEGDAERLYDPPFAVVVVAQLQRLPRARRKLFVPKLVSRKQRLHHASAFGARDS